MNNFLFLALLLSITSCFQENASQNVKLNNISRRKFIDTEPDFEFIWEWDTIETRHQDGPYSREIREFNEDAKVRIHLTELWKNGEWEKYSRTTYRYDSPNGIDSEIYEEWYNNHWNILSFYTFLNINNQKHLTSTQYWEYDEDNRTHLSESCRISYLFDSLQNIVNELYEVWHFDMNRWVKNGKVINTYDKKNRLISLLSLGQNDTILHNTNFDNSGNNQSSQSYFVQGNGKLKKGGSDYLILKDEQGNILKENHSYKSYPLNSDSIIRSFTNKYTYDLSGKKLSELTESNGFNLMKQFKYNELGKVVSYIEENDLVTSKQFMEIHYTYDFWGNCLSGKLISKNGILHPKFKINYGKTQEYDLNDPYVWDDIEIESFRVSYRPIFIMNKNNPEFDTFYKK